MQVVWKVCFRQQVKKSGPFERLNNFCFLEAEKAFTEVARKLEAQAANDVNEVHVLPTKARRRIFKSYGGFGVLK